MFVKAYRVCQPNQLEDFGVVYLLQSTECFSLLQLGDVKWLICFTLCRALASSPCMCLEHEVWYRGMSQVVIFSHFFGHSTAAFSDHFLYFNQFIYCGSSALSDSLPVAVVPYQVHFLWQQYPIRSALIRRGTAVQCLMKQ